MKRIIVVLLGISLLLSLTTNCLGEDGKKILFRDIPWGSTLKETINKLQGFEWSTGLVTLSGYTKPEKEKEKREPTGITPLQILYPNSVVKYTHHPMSFDIVSMTPIVVAGYKVTETGMYFAYVFAGNQIEKNEDNGRLISANYKFSDKNDAEMKKDIERKLSSVYGEPTKTADIKTQWGLENYTIWEDDEAKLYLRFRATNDSTKKNMLVLYYIWNDWQVVLDETENKLINLERNNVSGL